MLLQLMTWVEVENYLKDSQGIIIPIGSTEQHGPNGLIGTDSICADAIAKGVGDATGAIVGPSINVGMALHHTAFVGTISLSPTTLILLIQDYISCLARSGFNRFFFINGHGGNIATLKAAFAQTYAHLFNSNIDPTNKVQCEVGNWFMCRSVYKLAKELYGDEEGHHATPSEVAVTQYLYPDSIKSVVLSSEVNKDHKFYGAYDFRRRYPDGRMGSNPGLATGEHGKLFYEAAVEELSQYYRKWIAEG